MIRYRLDINEITQQAQYFEEEWEECDVCVNGETVRALRFVTSSGIVYVAPLLDYELQALNAGWLTPGSCTYHDKLPHNAVRKTQ